MTTKVVNGIRVEMSTEEALSTHVNIDSIVRLKQQLMSIELDKALTALIAPQKVQIDTMDENALRQAIQNGGL